MRLLQLCVFLVLLSKNIAMCYKVNVKDVLRQMVIQFYKIVYLWTIPTILLIVGTDRFRN